MPKKGDTLTGGTGDVNPQVFKMPVNIPIFATAGGAVAASYTAAQAFPLPIQRLPLKGDRSMIIEITKIRWSNRLFFQLDAAGAQNIAITGTSFLSTQQSTATLGLNPANNVYEVADPRVIDYASVTTAVGKTATTLFVFSTDNETPNIHDMTDGAGHGFLVATDQIYVGAQINVIPLDAAVYQTAFFAQCDIFYRFKDVSLKEYIGIVQSQQ